MGTRETSLDRAAPALPAPAARRAALQEIRNAAEGKAVRETASIEYLGDQIARPAASPSHSKLKSSKNLDTWRLNQVESLSLPLADPEPEPAMAESLVAEFDIIKTRALAGQNNVPEFLSEPTFTVLPDELYQLVRHIPWWAYPTHAAAGR